jgi:hypothetical protein
VVQGDAYALRDSLGDLLDAPASAVVSGLPLVTKPMLTRLKLIRDAFRGARARAPLRAVHLFGRAADPEIAAGRVHRSLRADLDEPSARAGLGVSQGLMPRIRVAHLAPNTNSKMSALKILVIPGSLRSGSLNAKLAAVAAHALALEGAEVTRISLSDFPLPIYDGDLQAKSGVPKQAVNLKRMMAAHHGVLIVTPEYNSSVPALVKNTIDWVSRVQDVARDPRPGVSASGCCDCLGLPAGGSAAPARWPRCG